MSVEAHDLRVMHVITGLDRGGAESQLATLLSAGAPGMGRTVVVSLLPGGAYRAALESAGVPIHDLDATRGRPNLLALWRLARLIRLHRPQILHGWMYHAQLFATLALVLSGCWGATRLVWGMRCSKLDFASYNRSLRWVVRACAWLSSWPAAVLFNSEAGLADHRELGFRPRRSAVIDNGINTERFRPAPAVRSRIRTELGIAPTTDLIAHVARVDPMKDHATFLAAMGTLDHAEALLIGFGTERLAPSANVHVLGVRDDVECLLAASDLIVSTSIYGEGFSNVLAEGMAAGLPAVTTDVGDSARIVGATGRIVPSGDPAALAEAMGSLLREPKDARTARGVEARSRIESNFSVAQAVDAHGALYASIEGRDHGTEPGPDRLGQALLRRRRHEAEAPEPGRTDTPRSGGFIDYLRGSGTRIAAVGVITLLCMVLAFHAVNLDAVGTALGGIEPCYAALAVLLFLFNALVAMVRFRVLLRGFGYSPTWRRLFAAFSVGLLGNQFVLNIMGQSVGRASVLTTSGVPFGATIIATFAERVLAAGVLAAAGLAAAWLLLPYFGFEPVQDNRYFLSVAGAMALAALAAAVVSYERTAAARTMAAAVRGVGRYWPVVMLTVLAHVLMLGGYLAVMLALGLDTLGVEVAGALLIVMFAAALPISLNGWGIRELSAVAVLGVIGIDSPTALAAGIVVGVLSLGVNLAVAVPGLWLALRAARDSEPARQDVGGRASNWNTRLVTGCAVLVAILMFFQLRIQGEGSVITANVADGFALIGLASLILLIVERRERLAALPRAFVRVLLAFSLLLAWALALGYVNFGASTWALVNRGLGWVIISGYAALGLSLGLLNNERNRHVVLRLFVTTGATVAVLQVMLLVSKIVGFPPPPEVFPYPLQGYANNAGAFGFQMTVTAIAAIVADRHGLLGTGRRWLFAMLVLIGIATYFSASRTSIGMFVLVIALSAAFAPPTERRAEIRYSLSVAVTVLFTAILLVKLPWLIYVLATVLDWIANLSFDAKESSFAGILRSLELKEVWTRTSLIHASSDHQRWQTIVDGWHLWMEHPVVGHGLGAYVHGQRLISQEFVVFHSVPIWLMAEMGLIGLAVGLACFAGLLLSARRMMRDPAHRAWGVGVLIALFCWGAASQVHDFFFQRSFWFFLGLAFGFAPAVIRNGVRVRTHRRGTSPPPRAERSSPPPPPLPEGD